MGQMKRIYEALCESQELEELLNRKPEPKPLTPVVHVLTCNGEIVNVFVDKQTALFEMPSPFRVMSMRVSNPPTMCWRQYPFKLIALIRHDNAYETPMRSMRRYLLR